MQMKIKNRLIFFIAFVLLMQPFVTAAAEVAVEPVTGGAIKPGSANAEGKKPDAEPVTGGPAESRIVLELPLLKNGGTSPFDFIMDPQKLITATSAVRYGGVKFEEGATLYFKNTSGDYEYSHRSDYLKITSRSNVPVRVTVKLAVKDTYDVNLVQSALFSDDRRCSMYFALLDSDGNETAAAADGTATFQVILPACEAENGVSSCLFALTGCCNPGGDWTGLTVCPRIVVTWMAEPLISDEGGL